jgi:hypothetical protein
MQRTWSIWFWGCVLLLGFGSYAYAASVPAAGQNRCYDSSGNEVPCSPRGRAFYGQGAPYNIAQSYTKLDSNGNSLPDSATFWPMVKDNVTGLIWEVKQNKDGVANHANPHDADNTYTWYDSNPRTNGGKAGAKNAGRDTESFLNILKSSRFGGYSDWRLPTIKELIFLVNHDFFIPSINAHFFPNTKGRHYWSSTNAGIPYGAWGVDFSYGFDGSYYKGYYFYAMAVRGGK